EKRQLLDVERIDDVERQVPQGDGAEAPVERGGAGERGGGEDGRDRDREPRRQDPRGDGAGFLRRVGAVLVDGEGGGLGRDRAGQGAERGERGGGAQGRGDVAELLAEHQRRGDEQILHPLVWAKGLDEGARRPHRDGRYITDLRRLRTDPCLLPRIVGTRACRARSRACRTWHRA